MLKKVLISLLLIACVLVTVSQLLAAKYKYDVTQSYQYALNNSTHTEFQVQFNHGDFSFNSPEKWDTGFIILKVKSDLTGYFSEPFIEIINQTKKSILTLERGVSGERYINLPNLAKGNAVNLQIVGHHVSISDQQAKIVLFNNPKLDSQAKVLIISPHPDDAEIAAFNFYAQHNSMVVTITAGEAGAHTYADVFPEIKKHYQVKGKLRVWNSISTPMLGGIPPEKAINLGYFDGTLMQMFQSKGTAVNSQYSGIKDVNYFRQQNISSLMPETSGSATWGALVSDLKEILLKFQPDIIVTPYPALDAHYDHKLSTLAVIEAIKSVQLTDGQLLLYTNHLTFNDYFPYGQQHELVPIPPDFNQSLYFDSIYSFHSASYREKIFALDSMNDLRPDTSWLNISGGFKVFKDALFNQLLLRDKTYFRKSVRENELFLSVYFSSLYKQEVIDSLQGQLN